MAELKEASVPDIGGYDDVPVIEVLVAVGDTVARDQGLVTLESDKATMEVPAPFAGVVKELKDKVGDAVSEGGVVAMIEAEGESAPEAAKPAPEVRSAETATAVPPAAPAGGMAAGGTRQAATPPVRFEADAVMPGAVPYASPAVR